MSSNSTSIAMAKYAEALLSFAKFNEHQLEQARRLEAQIKFNAEKATPGYKYMGAMHGRRF